MYTVFNFLVLGLKMNEVRVNCCSFFFTGCAHHFVVIQVHSLYIVRWTVPLLCVDDHLILACRRAVQLKNNIKQKRNGSLLKKTVLWSVSSSFDSTFATKIKSKLVLSSRRRRICFFDGKWEKNKHTRTSTSNWRFSLLTKTTNFPLFVLLFFLNLF